MVCLRVARSEGELQRQEVEYRVYTGVQSMCWVDNRMYTRCILHGTLLVIGSLLRR